MQASSALDTTWVKNGKNGNDYLAINQNPDGGVLASSESQQNRIWATSYAIPAVLGKTWNTIMHPVPKLTTDISSPILPLHVVEKNTENTVPKIKIIPPVETNTLLEKNTKKTSPKKPEIENTVPVVSPVVLSASAEQSGIPIFAPVTVGSIVAIGLLAYFGKRFFVKK